MFSCGRSHIHQTREKRSTCDVCIILNSVCNYLVIGTTIIHCVIVIITVCMMSSRYCMYGVIRLYITITVCACAVVVHVDIFSSVLRGSLNRLSFLSSHQPAVSGPRAQ